MENFNEGVSGGEIQETNNKDELLVEISNQNNNQSTPSLQESFAKFLASKKQERKLNKQILLNQQQKQRDENYKNDLREKFVRQAKSYIGVPYAKKYQPEDGPEYPLFLDCCGLVRQVVKDLQLEFGFVIGKWNQAYQYDTLPIRYQDIKEMKPGDLIFYSGEYSSKRSKLQKHDMVHVEIFLGGETGEETIGSRFQKGFVQIFPSYKFDSKLWSLKEFHFCSIETWLDGVCQSCCSEHPWITPSLITAGGKSIFDDDDDNDVSAGDDDLEEGTEEEEEKNNQLQQYVIDNENNSNLQNYESGHNNDGEEGEEEDEDPDMIGGGDGDDSDEEVKPRLKKAASIAQTDGKSKRSAAPQQSNSSVETKLKNQRVNRSRSMDSPPKSNKVTEPQQVSSKTGSKSSNRVPPPLTYYVGEGNGWRFIKTALDKRGWQQVPFEYTFSTRFTMKWVERRSQIDYSSYHEGQLVNHIPNNDIITTKLGMLNTLRNYYCCSPHNEQRIPTPWLPETYQIDNIADCIQLLQKDKQLSSASASGSGSGTASTPTSSSPSEPSHLWIYKPSSSNRGRGVRVLQGGSELYELLNEYHPQSVDTNGNFNQHKQNNSYSHNSGVVPGRGIIQEYIMRPLLVEGFKFDLRVYMLIACVKPFVAYYNPGYCRRTLRQYSLDISTLSDPIIHLSNTSIQKKSSDYKEQKENQVQLRPHLADLIERDGDPVSANYIRHQLDDEIMQCMVDIIKASKDQYLKKRGYFDLLGFDFMITNSPNNQTVLLEANTNPALCVGMNDFITELIDGTMELVLNHHNITSPLSSSSSSSSTSTTSEGSAAPPLSSSSPSLPNNFFLIYDEAKNYEFTKEKKK